MQVKGTVFEGKLMLQLKAFEPYATVKPESVADACWDLYRKRDRDVW